MFLIQSKKICSFNSFNINLLNPNFSKMVVGRFFLLLSSISKNQFLIKFVEMLFFSNKEIPHKIRIKNSSISRDESV